MPAAKTKIIIGVVVTVTVVAIALGITLITNSFSNANNKKANSISAQIDKEVALDDTRADGASFIPSTNFSLSLAALGDWGVSVDGVSCCQKYVRHELKEQYMDRNAQVNVADLMALSATKTKYSGVIAHGDSFYYNGIGKGDAAYRFEHTFEQVYSHPSLRDIPFYSVMGNHDLGGSGYVCGLKEGAWIPCKTLKETMDALEDRFQAQSSYRSPNNDRWRMPDRFYVVRFQDPSSKVTIDLFNLDSNKAVVHGAEQVCCQCYGYMGGKKKTDPKYIDCNTVHRGHPYCFGGDTQLFDACVNKINEWSDDSLARFVKAAANSDADFKIMNSHYIPQLHMDVNSMKEWITAITNANIQLYIGGHVHAEGHQYIKGTHFVINGAGGGIQSESIGDVPESGKKLGISSIWSAEGSPYGFFELFFSENTIRIKFITFADDWVFAEQSKDTVKGSTKEAYCYDIPKDGSKGMPCKV